MDEKTLNDIVKDCVRKAIDGCNKSQPSSKNLWPEQVLQGYFYCLLESKTSGKFDTEMIQREYDTELFYHREREKDKGFKYKDATYQKLVSERKRPKRGKIDIVILDPSGGTIDLPPNRKVRKALIGIELEYPTKRGMEKENFERHIRYDSSKLKGQIKNPKNRYLLCFVKEKPSFKLEKVKEEIKGDIEEINFAYIEFGKKPDDVPKGWLKRW